MSYILPTSAMMGETAGMIRVACLHTLPSSIAAYEAACPPDVRLIHHVRSDLFARAADGIDAALEAETSAYLQRILTGSDAVMLTCSLLASAARPPAHAAIRMMAEDLAEQAVGKRVEVMYVAPRELDFAEALFCDLNGPDEIRITRLAYNWDRRSNAREDEFANLTRRAIVQSDADVIALIHSGMAQIAIDDPRIVRMPATVLSRLAALHANLI